MTRLVLFFGLLLSGMLLLQSAWRAYLPKKAPLPPEKVNLALRRAAHILMQEAGDSTSRIAPVERLSENEWMIRMERGINYDQLPAAVQESFSLHHLHRDYDVALLRCTDGLLLLGYSFQDYSDGNQVPCQGRELPADCFNLKVTFAAAPSQAPLVPMAAWLLCGLLAAALLGTAVKWGKGKKESDRAPAAADWLTFGGSRLNVANQVLISGEKCHALTYREAKLLALFAQRPNQVLERSFILENVWADEGVLVGRSVDMFVSRLRKFLRDDPSVKLTAVHGVGYRMEVTQ